MMCVKGVFDCIQALTVLPFFPRQVGQQVAMHCHGTSIFFRVITINIAKQSTAKVSEAMVKVGVERMD